MCEYAALLSGHIDQMNTAEEEALIQAHLPQCAHCRELLRQMEAADDALRALPAEVPSDLTARIMQNVRSQPRKRRFAKRLIPLSTAGLAAAAMLVFVFSGALSELLLTKDSAANECAPYSAMYNMERQSAEEFAADDDGLSGVAVEVTKGTFRNENASTVFWNGTENGGTADNMGNGGTADGTLPFMETDGNYADTTAPGGWLGDWLPSMQTLLAQTLPN